MELKRIPYGLTVCKVADISAVDMDSDFYFLERLMKKFEKKGLRESRRPILTSSFDEYLFLFGKPLFVLLRKGEIQNTMLEACLDIFLGDVLTDIEASLH